MLSFADLSVDAPYGPDRTCFQEPCKPCCCDVHPLGHEDRIMYRLEGCDWRRGCRAAIPVMDKAGGLKEEGAWLPEAITSKHVEGMPVKGIG